jgi:hypothetical protein
MGRTPAPHPGGGNRTLRAAPSIGNGSVTGMIVTHPDGDSLRTAPGYCSPLHESGALLRNRISSARGWRSPDYYMLGKYKEAGSDKHSNRQHSFGSGGVYVISSVLPAFGFNQYKTGERGCMLRTGFSKEFPSDADLLCRMSRDRPDRRNKASSGLKAFRQSVFDKIPRN